jgi:hypothetical protein
MHSPERTGGIDKYKEFWKVMKPHYDVAAEYIWNEAANSGLSQKSFASSSKNRSALSAFMSMQDLDGVVAGKNDFEKVPQQVSRIVTLSRVGTSMYKHAGAKASRGIFRSEIDDKLNDLQHLDFDEAACVNFVDAMKRLVNQMVKNGHSAYKKYEVHIQFLAGTEAINIETPTDEWEFRFYALVKLILINTGKIQLLPWERVIIEPGKLPGVMTQLTVPQQYIDKVLVGREALLDLLTGNRLNLADMKKDINAKVQSVYQLDRTAELEVSFLNSKAEKLLLEKVRQQVLDCLPTPTVTKVYSVVAAAQTVAFDILYFLYHTIYKRNIPC